MTEPCIKCGVRPGAHTFGNGLLCDECVQRLDGDSGGESEEAAAQADAPAELDAWGSVAFTETESGAYPTELLEREQWMARDGKLPFAPWADRDHPKAAADEDARWKWGITDNYVDGETVAMAEEDHRVDGRVFLQQDEDPYAFVDGDDVRCPETGEVHPAFVAILEQLGLTYADVSTSGSGVHAYYRGELPIDGKGQAAFDLDTEPLGANDDSPTIELYANKHVNVATGERAVGAPTDIAEWNHDALRTILRANGYEDKERVAHDTDRDRAELDDYEPDATSAGETTTSVRDILAAVDRLEPRDVRLSTTRTGEDSTGWSTWDPSYRSSESGESLHYNGEGVFYDHKEGEEFGVLALRAAEEGIISDPWDRLTGSEWWDAVDLAREDGAAIPEFDEEAAADEQRLVETCAAPALESAPFDADERRRAFKQERYERFIEADAPVVWADEAGAGKTTTAGIAADARGRPHALLFDKHQKAREYRRDESTPDGYYHLRGGEQKRRDTCMDADHADEDCPDHGDTRNCPSACPVYDLAPDSEIRQQYDRLKAEVGPVRAHMVLGDELPEHDEDGSCWWLEQFGEASSSPAVVGVHEYQTLATIQSYNDDERDVIVDESPGTVAEERRLTVEGALRFQSRLEQLADLYNVERDGDLADTMRQLAAFADEVLEVLADDHPADTLVELEPPEISAETRTVEVDPDDPPAWCDPADVYRGTRREHRGMPDSGAYTEREVWVADRSRLDEALAQAKVAYSEATVEKMKRGEWKGEPLAMDVLLAAAAEAGLEGDAIRRAIAAPAVLDRCPRCGGELAEQEGARFCSQDGRCCGWDERTDPLVGFDDTPARADVERRANVLEYRELPAESDLPDSPLVLDATATPEKIAGLYGVSVDDVRVDGVEPVEANLRVTQVLDGQYHAGTIADSDRLHERIQNTIEKVGRLHERPLYVGKQSVLRTFDIPNHGETLKYHAARGLNRADCDAVVCIGAPHPRVDGLERDARLLAMNRDGHRVGGEEHSTRRDCPNAPVYRKLRYADADGSGRAVATKHFTGLTGALFRERREKELEQVVHRVRPLLAEETKHAYLLTNVPTDLRVDEVCSFDELADPLAALFPVAEGALELAMAVRDAAAGDVPEGFRAETLVEAVGGEEDAGSVRFRVSALHRLARLNGLDVSERTVRRWVDDLECVGLLDAGEYESRAGVPYTADLVTLTEALRVLSSNESVEVAFRRRLAALAAEAESARDWLAAAREQLGVSGDCCTVGDWPPPGSAPG